MNRVLLSAAILSLGLWAAGCKNDNKDTEPAGHHKMADKNMEMASASIEPTKGNTAKGTVMFHQMGDKVHVVADISGLTPNAKHAIHIHEGTECGEDGMKAGGHYNPEKHDHGLPNAPADKRHAGDFGNLSADGSGKAHLDLTVDNITISGQKNPIVGHAVIVHAKVDDGSQPTGNAGARIGCGIIKAGGGARADLGTDSKNAKDELSLYQFKGSEPAIRLSQNSWRAMFGEFELCPVCTKTDFSQEVDHVYRNAGVPQRTKDPELDSAHSYTIVPGSGGILTASMDNSRIIGAGVGRVSISAGTLSAAPTTTKSSGAK